MRHPGQQTTTRADRRFGSQPAFVGPSGVAAPPRPIPLPVLAHETAAQTNARIVADNAALLAWQGAVQDALEATMTENDRIERQQTAERTDRDWNATMTTAGHAFDSIVSSVNTALQSGSNERMQAAMLASRERMAALHPSDPAQAEELRVLRSALAALQARADVTPPQGMPRGMLYLGLGVGALVLLGGVALVVTRTRNNPYGTRANVIVTSRKGHKRYMSKAARRRQLARSRSAR